MTLLERAGGSAAAAGVLGGLVLFAGIVTRPVGGALARGPGPAVGRWSPGASSRRPRGPSSSRREGRCGSRDSARSRSAWPPACAIFDAAQRTRPDAPGAAVALVNGCAVLTILVSTPLAGLAFDLPGDGAVAFAAIGALIATSLLAVPRARL